MPEWVHSLYTLWHIHRACCLSPIKAIWRSNNVPHFILTLIAHEVNMHFLNCAKQSKHKALVFDWCNSLWKSRHTEHLGLDVEGNLVLPPPFQEKLNPWTTLLHPLCKSSVLFQLQNVLEAADFGRKAFDAALEAVVSGDTHRCSQAVVPLRVHSSVTVGHFHQVNAQLENMCSISENEICHKNLTHRYIFRVSFSGVWNNCSHQCSESSPLHNPERHHVHRHE